MSDFIITNNANSFIIKEGNNSSPFSRNDLDIEFSSDNDQIFRIRDKSVNKKLLWIINLSEDSVDVDGVTSFADAKALFDEIEPIFFLINSGCSPNSLIVVDPSGECDYLTPMEAVSVAVSGNTIQVNDGVYLNQTNLTKDGVNWEFGDNAFINTSNGDIFHVVDGAEYRVKGGRFQTSGGGNLCFDIKRAGTRVFIDNVNATSLNATTISCQSDFDYVRVTNSFFKSGGRRCLLTASTFGSERFEAINCKFTMTAGSTADKGAGNMGAIESHYFQNCEFITNVDGRPAIVYSQINPENQGVTDLVNCKASSFAANGGSGIEISLGVNAATRLLLDGVKIYCSGVGALSINHLGNVQTHINGGVISNVVEGGAAAGTAVYTGGTPFVDTGFRSHQITY